MRYRPVLCICFVAPMVLCPATRADGSASPRPPIPLSAFTQAYFSANALDPEPFNGFIPQVVVGLTDEQNHSDSVVGYGVKSAAPGGVSLPSGGSQQYVVATLDSGAQGNIFSYDAGVGFDFAGAGREGTKSIGVQGVSGIVNLPISDSVGVYMTGFSNASVSGGGVLGVAPGSLKGQWNVPVLTGVPEAALPNVIGSPILSQYRVSIQNSQPQHLTVGDTTYRTPAVTLGDFSSAPLPAGWSKLTLKTSEAGPPDAPYYINYDITGANNPDSPGAWSSLLTNGGVALSRNGAASSNHTFLLDTGAQISLISYDTAASVGLFNVSLDNAEFEVEVLGFGGISKVPGYYLNTISLTTQGGIINWNRVPVIVLDVGDPRDPGTALPGILGTNLFGDRDLILNTNVTTTGQNYLAIGPQWMWQTNGSGTWTNANNWSVVLPNGIDTQANFYGAITSAATVTVDSAKTVGTITFDNVNRYTLAGPGAITLSMSVDPAQVNVLNGSHTIAAPVILASDATAAIVPAASTMTISGNISSSGAHGITKVGGGSLLLSGTTSYTGETVVKAGSVELGNNARAPILTLAGGADVQGGRLVFKYAGGTNPAGTIKSLLTTSYADGFATARIRSTTADGTYTLGWKDDSATSQVIIAYTLYGDTNLDGAVDVTDLGNMATYFGLASGANWVQGDFDYNGNVNIADLGDLATNFGQSVEGGGTAAAASIGAATVAIDAVPEPASIGSLVVAGLLAFRRRRR